MIYLLPDELPTGAKLPAVDSFESTGNLCSTSTILYPGYCLRDERERLGQTELSPLC
jgi:hypothetical protein